jgi:serine/threonine protein kinase
MSITQPIMGRSPSGNLNCPQCNTPLPAQATFCANCGERIDTLVPGGWRKGSDSSSETLLHRTKEMDIAARYRITSLVRRRPYVNLFFALDNRQQRMVAIRDIDISSLDEESQVKAIELVESEYDLLRRSLIPHVMPVIDLRHFQDHIFVISNSEPRWEIAIPRGIRYADPSRGQAQGTAPTDEGQGAGSNEQLRRLYTLQDLLQSGIGLPAEQVAIDWITRLCRSLDHLHTHQIVVGDLDPYTLILNTDSYESQPVLMVSWLPSQLRSMLPRTSTMTNTSYFSAPEALLGNAEPRSDIYSLGAILYLLLTGTPPDEPDWRNGANNRQVEAHHAQRESSGTIFSSRQRLRSVRELNPHVSSGIDECILRALSLEPSERFQSGEEMAAALRKGQALLTSI